MRPAPKKLCRLRTVSDRMHRDRIAWTAGKARGARISGIFERRATPPAPGPQRGSRVGVEEGCSADRMHEDFRSEALGWLRRLLPGKFSHVDHSERVRERVDLVMAPELRPGAVMARLRH